VKILATRFLAAPLFSLGALLCTSVSAQTCPSTPPFCPAVAGDDLTLAPTAAPACAEAVNPVTFAYAGSGATARQIELYRPSSVAAPYPTVIFIHGGGWTTGSRVNPEIAKRLVCRGYAVASIDYRLSGAAKFPAQIVDVKAAIRYLRANAQTLLLDGSKFAAFGNSAGAHLAALTATSNGVADLEDLTMGNANVSSDVQAAVDWFGPTDFSQMDAQVIAQGCGTGSATHNLPSSPESLLLGCTVSDPACANAIARANPLTYVSAKTPPIYIMHGSRDCTVPNAQSEILKAAMQAAGRCVFKRNALGAGHGGNDWLSAPAQNAVADFLDGMFK
jgi:acetyl esterase/lipase